MEHDDDNVAHGGGPSPVFREDDDNDQSRTGTGTDRATHHRVERGRAANVVDRSGPPVVVE